MVVLSVVDRKVVVAEAMDEAEFLRASANATVFVEDKVLVEEAFSSGKLDEGGGDRSNTGAVWGGEKCKEETTSAGENPVKRCLAGRPVKLEKTGTKIVDWAKCKVEKFKGEENKCNWEIEIIKLK